MISTYHTIAMIEKETGFCCNARHLERYHKEGILPRAARCNGYYSHYYYVADIRNLIRVIKESTS